MEPTGRTNQLSKEATRRLLRDWKEVQKEPIKTVKASPLENDLSEWHCNLTPDEGPYRGTAFHLVLTFPADYPNNPPDVRVCTYLSHPNVFGEWICLDMIKSPEYYARPYQGWSTAYSVQSVLLQLQSFLFAENVDQDYGDRAVNRASAAAVSQAKREAGTFYCRGCGFKGSAALASDCRREGGTLVLPRRLSAWENNVDDSIAGVRIAGGRRAPRPAARARAVPPSGTVNDLILQALDRRVRTPSEPNARRRGSPEGSVPAAQAAEPQTPAKPAPADEAPATATVKSESKPAKTPYASVLSPQSPQTNPPESLSLKSPSKRRPLETPQTPPKPLPVPTPSQAPPKPLEVPPPVDHLSELHADVLVQIMDRLDAPSLSALARASRRFVRVSTERGAWVRRELQCFHSKLGFTEEVLGFGLATKGSDTPAGSRRNDGHCGSPDCPICGPLRREAPSKPGAGKWEGVLSMDYLSSGAFFEGGVRKGVWNERLEWWLPLLLDDQHAARAMPLLKGTIAALAANPRRPSLTRAEILRLKFSPLDTLKVLPRLMNGMVVSFMKQKGGAGDKVDLHASEKALLGYCQLHHMLLQLAQEYPVIQESIDRALSRFQSRPSARNKTQTPDLGELLVLLSVAKTGGVTWASLAEAFVSETFERNVLWLLRDHPELAFLEASWSVSEYRLKTTFDASATSRRLIMFQVAFLLLVRPSGSSVGDILAAYSQRYGYPRPGLTRALQATWYKVLKVATWPSYFAQLGLACPSKPIFCSMLRQYVVSSSKKGYHSAERLRLGGTKALLKLRRQHEPTVRTSWRVEEKSAGPEYGQQPWKATAERGGPVSSASIEGFQLSSTARGRTRAYLNERDQINIRNARDHRIPHPTQTTVVSRNPFAVLELESE